MIINKIESITGSSSINQSIKWYVYFTTTLKWKTLTQWSNLNREREKKVTIDTNSMDDLDDRKMIQNANWKFQASKNWNNVWIWMIESEEKKLSINKIINKVMANE